jgi:hypothetical protein
VKFATPLPPLDEHPAAATPSATDIETRNRELIFAPNMVRLHAFHPAMIAGAA